MEDFSDVLFGVLEHTEIGKSRNFYIFQTHPGRLPRVNPHTVFISRDRARMHFKERPR